MNAVARVPTDEELLVGDDPDRFAAFYRRHVRALLAYLARATRDPETAADLTAETFAAALVARRRDRPDRGPARAWLFGIAHNKLADWRRRGYAEAAPAGGSGWSRCRCSARTSR